MADNEEEMTDKGQENVVAPVVGGLVAVAVIIALVIVMITWMLIRSNRNYSVTTSSTGYVHCIYKYLVYMHVLSRVCVFVVNCVSLYW